MITKYLVCYDITKNRRLAKVFKHLKERGIHLQYSVFYCSLSWEQLKNLKGDLQKMINPKYDDIRIYPLPASKKILVLGRPNLMPEDVDLFIV